MTSWDDHLEQTTASSFIATNLSNVVNNHICFGSFICHQFVTEGRADRQTSAGIVHMNFATMTTLFWTMKQAFAAPATGMYLTELPIRSCHDRQAEVCGTYTVRIYFLKKNSNRMKVA